MPTFYFHVHDDIDAIDEEGAEFPDEEAALAWARREARELAAEAVKSGLLRLDHRIVVVREPSETIGTVTFGDAVRAQG
jgi:hypothetical protein